MKFAQELLVFYFIKRDGQTGPPNNVLILCTMCKEHTEIKNVLSSAHLSAPE